MSNNAKKNLAILVSGGGTNMQAILDNIDNGNINAAVVVVISSNDKAYALTRAKAKNIPSFVYSLKDFEGGVQRDKAIVETLKKHNTDYVILAGYLGIITSGFVREFKNRIINIHPALLPAYGGVSYHGINVHRAVIEAKEPFSGATVHFVDEGVDTGLIIAQEKTEVSPLDTPETLQQKILNNIEHKLLIKVVKDLCENKIKVENNKVILCPKKKNTEEDNL